MLSAGSWAPEAWLPNFWTKCGIFGFFGFRPRKKPPQIFWRGGIPVILCGNASEELLKKLLESDFLFSGSFSIFVEREVPRFRKYHGLGWWPGLGSPGPSRKHIFCSAVYDATGSLQRFFVSLNSSGGFLSVIFGSYGKFLIDIGER